MNYIISIIDPAALDKLTDIADEMGGASSTVMMGYGTAVPSMLDLLGIKSTEKRVVFTAASVSKTRAFIKAAKRRLFIGVPGHGIIVAVPIKAIGGGSALAYLGGDSTAKYTPELNYKYELIVAIANEGRTDAVMNAARAAGATGGTVLHGKGTGNAAAEKFMNVSIAKEKEVILIVARADQKTEIMREIVKRAGPGSEAGAIVFSLPTSEVAGFGMFDDDKDE